MLKTAKGWLNKRHPCETDVSAVSCLVDVSTKYTFSDPHILYITGAHLGSSQSGRCPAQLAPTKAQVAVTTKPLHVAIEIQALRQLRSNSLIDKIDTICTVAMVTCLKACI
jgi:hypothetical protein